MKTASTLCLAAALVSGVSCERLLQESGDAVVALGFSQAPAIQGAAAIGEEDPTGSAADQLVEALEGDSQVTGQSRVIYQYYSSSNSSSSSSTRTEPEPAQAPVPVHVILM